uniref:Phage ABA sandwich domain-containing protein n=1 Tax=Magnetococcus massalia (strain MO-1) TaxID=451514 RepID=A0A1S7LEN9_MAGMO|nr:conserved protein of unknown function [Candidatus Magnetococcus massalia]
MQEQVRRLFAMWQEQGSVRNKEHLLAGMLGDPKRGGDTPHYCSDIKLAQDAMDRAWNLLEEYAPVRVACHVEGDGASKEGRSCHVEWWPEDGDHIATPTFDSEAESRAFAAFAFLKLEAGG